MSDALLSIADLSRRFGGVVAVGGVGLVVAPGEVHGLIGPNGAGKTTMLNLVSGHLLPSAGRIDFAGQDVTRAPAHRRAQLGLRRTFQNLKLFRQLSALENVVVGLHAETRSEMFAALLRTRAQRAEERGMRERAAEALDIVGLGAVADQPAGGLPYGHQRLLEIARAIVARPKLVLLDEPAAGLNHQEGARLVGLIRRIRDLGITILMVEHHMDVVMPTCDRITVLNYGRKLADGTPAEIRRDPEVIRAYLGKGSSAHARPRTRPPQAVEALRAAS